MPYRNSLFTSAGLQVPHNILRDLTKRPVTFRSLAVCAPLQSMTTVRWCSSTSLRLQKQRAKAATIHYGGLRYANSRWLLLQNDTGHLSRRNMISMMRPFSVSTRELRDAGPLPTYFEPGTQNKPQESKSRWAISFRALRLTVKILFWLVFANGFIVTIAQFRTPIDRQVSHLKDTLDEMIKQMNNMQARGVDITEHMDSRLNILSSAIVTFHNLGAMSAMLYLEALERVSASPHEKFLEKQQEFYTMMRSGIAQRVTVMTSMLERITGKCYREMYEKDMEALDRSLASEEIGKFNSLIQQELEAVTNAKDQKTSEGDISNDGSEVD